MSTITGDIRPLAGRILVRDLQFGESKTAGGVIIMDDDGKERGIHPRWARVWRVADDVLDVKENDWVLIEHGRWTRTFKIELDEEEFKVNMIDPKGIMMVSDRPMTDTYYAIAKTP